MTVFDYVVLFVVAVSLVLGMWRGVVGEIIALVAWVLAFFAARWWGSLAAQGLPRSLIRRCGWSPAGWRYSSPFWC